MAENTKVDQWIAKAKNHPWIAALCVFGIAVIGIASFKDAIGKLWQLVPGRNPYTLVLLHEQDQSGHIVPFEDTGAIASRWTAIISNRSDEADSLVRVAVIASRDQHDIEYSGFNGDLLGNMYDAEGEGHSIKLPINLEAGHSIRISIGLAIIMDARAFEVLRTAYPDGEIAYLQEANKLVAKALQTDMFGQPAKLMQAEGDGPLGFGLAVFSDQKNPRVTVNFRTARGLNIQGTADWYKSERSTGPLSPAKVRENLSSH